MEHKPLNNLFLSVGAMKAGTTWLYSVLSRHPSLCFSREKEIHFFYHQHVRPDMLSPQKKQENVVRRYLPQITRNVPSSAALAANLRWCASYLSEPTNYQWFNGIFPVHAPSAYLCEFSNLTAHLGEEGWRRVAADTRNLKVIYVLRDPFKRLWSHIKFHLEFSGQIDSLRTWSAADMENFTRQPFVWQNAEYGAAIARMKAALPPGSWRVIFYEDIHADQRKVLREIEDFLGIVHVEYPESVLSQRPTEGPRHPEPPYFRSLFQADVDRIRREMTAQGVAPHPAWS